MYEPSGWPLDQRPQIIQDIKERHPVLSELDLDYLQFRYKRDLMRDWDLLNSWLWPENIPHPEPKHKYDSPCSRRSALCAGIEEILKGVPLFLELCHSVDDEYRLAEMKEKVNGEWVKTGQIVTVKEAQEIVSQRNRQDGELRVYFERRNRLKGAA